MSAPARAARRNPTEAERRLWAVLRSRRLAAFKFRRQHPEGAYVLDFACTRHHLVIECDGGQHSESATDPDRTSWLVANGWRVLRFWNNDILNNTEGVLTAILAALPTKREAP